MDANLRRQTLADTLRRTAHRVPHRLGLACGATRWTYRELHAVCERLAAGLAARGIERGDKVAVLARNSHGFVALRYALMQPAANRRPRDRKASTWRRSSTPAARNRARKGCS